jgi:hypothetical protein
MAWDTSDTFKPERDTSLSMLCGPISRKVSRSRASMVVALMLTLRRAWSERHVQQLGCPRHCSCISIKKNVSRRNGKQILTNFVGHRTKLNEKQRLIDTHQKWRAVRRDVRYSKGLDTPPDGQSPYFLHPRRTPPHMGTSLTGHMLGQRTRVVNLKYTCVVISTVIDES